MEILQNLLSIFLNSENGRTFAPLLKLLIDNQFDLLKTIKCLDSEKLRPLIQALYKGFSQKSATKNPTENSAGCSCYLNPIVDFADQEIVRSLNKYLASC